MEVQNQLASTKTIKPLHKLHGDTDGSHLMRMKQPHSSKILEWLDARGISKYKFISDGSSAADKTFTALHIS